MYARSNVYFVIATSLDNQELLDWRTVVAATGTFTVRQEFSDDGVFDNSPQGGNLIDFAEDFFRHLELDEIEATIFDFSNRSPPTGALTIARDIQRVVYRGQYNRGTVFNNVNIVVADRTTPLTIEFENFGMRASEDTVAIRSASQVDITISLTGNNRIMGGAGRTALTGAGREGHGGRAAIDINGNLILTGGGSAHIEGGSGTPGNAGNNQPINGTRTNTSEGNNGSQGGIGGEGGAGINAASLSVLAAIGNLTIIGGRGGNGGTGGTGEGIDGPGHARAGHGGNGGNGGNGAHGVFLSGSISFDLQSIQSLQITGGAGGQGGTGGQGGRGYGQASGRSNDHGGDGGTGGLGGIGGDGIRFQNTSGTATGSMPGAQATIRGGNGGNGGNGGIGGEARRSNIAGQGGTRGKGGTGGNGGNGGTALRSNNIPTVTLNPIASNGGGAGIVGAIASHYDNSTAVGSAPSSLNSNGIPGANGPQRSWP
jgi:hypothetical protein